MSDNIKIIADNRKASFDYFLLDRYEAGIVLTGTEIKSLRKGSCNIRDSYVVVKNGEAFIINMHISKYDEGNIFNHDPLRTRKLLLHKREINKLIGTVKVEGLTLVPTKVYLVRGRAKVEFAVAKGKKNYDKREDDRKNSIKKELRKYVKEKY